MSKYNNRNNHRNNKFNEKKNFKQNKVDNIEIKAPLVFLEEVYGDKISNEIINVLKEVKFDKISIPVGTYKNLFDPNLDENDTRVFTVGYIRGYDPEELEFTVVVYGKFAEDIKSLGTVGMDLKISSYKDYLGSINKFILVPIVILDADDEEYCTDCECSCSPE